MNRTAEELLLKLKQLPVIDTHEHFAPEQYLQSDGIHFFTLLAPYVCDNMFSAGMTPEEWAMLQTPQVSLAQKTEIFGKYIPLIKYTTFFRVLDQMLRNGYALQDYSESEIFRVNQLIQKENTPEQFSQILQSSHIQSVFTFLPFDICNEYQSDYMHYVPTVSDICPRDWTAIQRLEACTGKTIVSFSAFLEAINQLFANYVKRGVKAIKFGSGYRRVLNFGIQTYHDAEQIFNMVLSHSPCGDTIMCGGTKSALSDEDITVLDDFLTFYMVKQAGEHGLKVFFHCGLHAWNQNNPEATKIGGLRSLIALNKKVDFILLHCGYPYCDDALLLAKYYPNVYLNLTWLHIIDRVKAVETIKRMVEFLPINKIQGFGGDYCTLRIALTHLDFALENIAVALADFIDQGVMTTDEAEQTAAQWLYNNPANMFGICLYKSKQR